MTDEQAGGTASQLYSEEHLATRVALEREVRGWSTGELAARMTEAGVPMNQSAIWRIESGTPRRRINLDEAIGFARVFELPLEEVMSAPQEGLDIEGRRLVQEAVEAFYTARDAQDQLHDALGAVAGYIEKHPECAHGVHEQYRRLTGDERDAHTLTLHTEEGT